MISRRLFESLSARGLADQVASALKWITGWFTGGIRVLIKESASTPVVATIGGGNTSFATTVSGALPVDQDDHQEFLNSLREELLKDREAVRQELRDRSQSNHVPVVERIRSAFEQLPDPVRHQFGRLKP